MWVWLILIIGGICLFFLERYSLKDPEKRIGIESSFQKRYAEVEETISLEIRMTNKGRLPVFYCHVQQSMGDGLEAKDPAFSGEHWRSYAGIGTLKDTFFLPGRRSIRRTYSLNAMKRGCYSLQRVHVSVGDFLGIRESSFGSEARGEVIVLPQKSHRRDIPVSIGNLQGDISVQRFIHEDPILTAGYAEYTGREPWKSISWTQSARVNRMLVKKYDHTAEQTVTVFLDIEQAGEQLEECLSLARTVCETMDKKGMSWGFCTNADLYRMRAVSDMAQGNGRTHLYRVLEALAYVDGHCTDGAEDYLKKLSKAENHSVGYLIIQPSPKAELAQVIQRLKADSGSVIYILYAEGGMKKC